MRLALGPGLLPAVFWLVLSGHYTPLLLTLGALSVACVCWLVHRAGLDGYRVPLAFVLRLPGYLLWLGGEVLRSAWAVARTVWSPRPHLRPVVVPVPAERLPELSRVVYANSITLTPGTLSLDVEADRIEVHSLVPDDIKALREGAMLARVRRTESGR
ncbi:Na+/H+ antiporter subunit E [Streptomyces boninensis]|uniref:Na+/H+ antiporter subunit E n=1 Tax=Streptomyces boninensis TaxID=2039455 RepID=UPI003B2176EA